MCILQMRDLSKYGKAITSITLTEAEFLHPQTLNPIALNCPRLTSLTIINPTTISDNLFVGEGMYVNLNLTPPPYGILWNCEYDISIIEKHFIYST